MANAAPRERGWNPTPLLVLGMVLASGWAASRAADQRGLVPGESRPEGQASAAAEPPSETLRREGSQLEQVAGVFKLQGQRIMFQPLDSPQRFTVLENLLLERIARMNDASDRSLQWLVSGTLTQFQGANYLLVTHAVVKQPPPPGARHAL